jgi:hypothetical protein
MAKITKAPTFNPIKPLPTAKAPPPSKTMDNFTHHTSPVQGPQIQPMTNINAQSPGAKVKITADIPMHVVKHDDSSSSSS